MCAHTCACNFPWTSRQTEKSMLSCFTAQRIMLSSVIFFIHSSSFLLILTVWFWGGRREWSGLYHQSLDRCITPYDWGRDEMNELSHKVQGEWRVLLFEFLCFPATARPLHQDCTYHLYFSRKEPEHTAVCYKYFDRGSQDRVVRFWKSLCEPISLVEGISSDISQKSPVNNYLEDFLDRIKNDGRWLYTGIIHITYMLI